MKKLCYKIAGLVLTAFILCSVITLFPIQAHAKSKAKSTTAATVYPAAKDVAPEAMHNYVNMIIAGCTTNTMTQEQKLAACYNYVLDHMKYKRSLEPASASKVEDYALEAFFTGQGNCYRYASMFAYMAAELGYNVQIQAGQCISTQGGWTPHSWVFIAHPDGRGLIYDCSFGDSNRGKINFFGITADQHPRALWVQEVWIPSY